MKFFYLKIGKSNHLAEKWLSGENPLKKPAAVIFFGHCSINDIKQGKSNQQVRDFFECSQMHVRDEVLITVVHHGKICFLKPMGDLEEYQDASDDGNLWKIMPVTIVREKRLFDVPPVLAGINANTFLSTGTFRSITNWGNIKAIYSSLDMALPSEHLSEKECNPMRLLECLSSVELETLIAKLFEAAGCFVPAYRGGNIKDVDLFVHNDKDKEIKLGGLSIPPNSGITVQIKSSGTNHICPQGIDILISLTGNLRSNCFNSKYTVN